MHDRRFVEFRVPGIPVPWARAGSRSGIRFTPARQRRAMVEIKTMAWQAMAGRAPFTGPIELHVTGVWVVPRSWSQKKRNAACHRTGKPDADNLGKIIADSLNGIVYVDDAQVIDLRVIKIYGPMAQIMVEVMEIAKGGNDGIRHRT